MVESYEKVEAEFRRLLGSAYRTREEIILRVLKGESGQSSDERTAKPIEETTHRRWQKTVTE